MHGSSRYLGLSRCDLPVKEMMFYAKPTPTPQSLRFLGMTASSRSGSRCWSYPAKTDVCDYYKLTYVLNGRVSCMLDGSELFLLGNSLCLICPESLHELIAHESGAVAIDVCLRPSLFEAGVFAQYLANDNPVSQTMRGQSPHRHLVFSDTHDNMLLRSLRALVREYIHSDYSASFMVQGCTLILLAQLAQIDTYSLYGLDRQMMDVVDFVREHCDTISVSSLAAQNGYGVAYYSRLVKSRCGIGARELIVSARLNRARELLINTDLSIQDIASAVGYTSYSHFNRIFRKTYQMSPAEYRSFIATISRLT